MEIAIVIGSLGLVIGALHFYIQKLKSKALTTEQAERVQVIKDYAKEIKEIKSKSIISTQEYKDAKANYRAKYASKSSTPGTSEPST